MLCFFKWGTNLYNTRWYNLWYIKATNDLTKLQVTNIVHTIQSLISILKSHRL